MRLFDDFERTDDRPKLEECEDSFAFLNRVNTRSGRQCANFSTNGSNGTPMSTRAICEALIALH